MYQRVIKSVAILGATVGVIGGSAALANAATGGGSTSPMTPSQTAPQQHQQPGHHCHHPGGAGGTGSSGTSYGGGQI